MYLRTHHQRQSTQSQDLHTRQQRMQQEFCCFDDEEMAVAVQRLSLMTRTISFR